MKAPESICCYTEKVSDSFSPLGIKFWNSPFWPLSSMAAMPWGCGKQKTHSAHKFFQFSRSQACLRRRGFSPIPSPVAPPPLKRTHRSPNLHEDSGFFFFPALYWPPHGHASASLPPFTVWRLPPTQQRKLGFYPLGSPEFSLMFLVMFPVSCHKNQGWTLGWDKYTSLC